MATFDPNKMDPRLIRRFNEQEEEIQHREKQIAETHEDGSRPGGDFALPQHNRHQLVNPKAHLSEKLYFFPESFNALRRELEENYPTFFNSINPEFGYSPAYAMVFNGPQFVGFCNGALEMDVQFDSENIEEICKKFLNGFRQLRGVSPIV